ncbi:thioesterase family protein [Bailinhaonella thermotolerans]|nr:thioesterase family protein [Bailinhaonella thermotolerans]
MAEAFYVPLAEGRFRSTESTQGPWHPEQQHMGPVTALLARELELTAPRPEMSIAQLTVDVLAPVPLAELTVRTEVVRDGKRVQCLAAEVSGQGRTLVRARAWRIRESGTEEAATPRRPVPAPVEDGLPPGPSSMFRGFGYAEALEWRFLHGVDSLGPAVAWGRLRGAVVEGEEPSPLQRVAVFADSGNGISHTIDFTAYLFVNVDLSISLYRRPEGPWICLDAATEIGPQGRGLTRTGLFDESGEVGVSTQTLFVGLRP